MGERRVIRCFDADDHCRHPTGGLTEEEPIAGGVRRIRPRQNPDLRSGMSSLTHGIFPQQPRRGNDELWGGISSVSERSADMRVTRMT
jgi:hypothetical protein